MSLKAMFLGVIQKLFELFVMALLIVQFFGVPIATYWHLAFHEDHKMGLDLTVVSIMLSALVAAMIFDFALHYLLDSFNKKGSTNVH